MAQRKKSSELREKIHGYHEENELKHIESNRNRARSVTVGTAFGGVVEVMMRSEFGYMFALLQPVEAIEIIEQLAAGCGIEIAMRPKQNFSTWRGWETTEDNVYVKGSAPFQIKDSKKQNALKAAAEEVELEFEKQRLEMLKEKRLKRLESKIEKQVDKEFADDEDENEVETDE